MRFQILALSGGGYLGLFIATILAELEAKLDRPLARSFDLICGTSIGGILALGLGAEIPAARMRDAFQARGSSIFSDRPKPQGLAVLADLARFATRPKYDAGPLREVVLSLLGQQPLSASMHRLLIPAVNMTRGEVQMFKTAHSSRYVRDHRQSMVDIAMATAAAPTYFPLAEVGDELFADGGLYANAPDLCGLHEATTVLQAAESDVHVLSIGTTTTTYSVAHAGGRNLGFLQWMAGGRLLSTMLAVQQQLTDNLMRQRLASRYLRIDRSQSPEQQQALALDVATPEAQRTISGLASGALRPHDGTAELEAFLRHTASPPTFHH